MTAGSNVRASRPSRISPLKRLAFNLLIVGGTLAIALLGFELVLRAIEPKSPPGTTYGRIVTKNSNELRDREFAIPKPPDTYRVLVLGDSFTWGVGLDIEETIPKQLEAALRTTTASTIEVINAAVPGMNTVNELAMLKEHGLKYEPDMILLVYLLNDIDFKPELAPQAYAGAEAVPVVQIDAGRDATKWSKWKGIRGTILRIEQNSALARFMVPRVGQVLHSMGMLNSVEFSWIAKVFQGFDDANPGWLESKRALKEIADISRERQIPFVVAIYPLLVGLENYQGRHANRAVEEYCRSIGADVIDLLPVFEGKSGRSFWVNYADHHPNAEAHRLVTRTLLPVVRRHMPVAHATQ
jgi:lysophospholipase L1-like esterase